MQAVPVEGALVAPFRECRRELVAHSLGKLHGQAYRHLQESVLVNLFVLAQFADSFIKDLGPALAMGFLPVIVDVIQKAGGSKNLDGQVGLVPDHSIVVKKVKGDQDGQLPCLKRGVLRQLQAEEDRILVLAQEHHLQTPRRFFCCCNWNFRHEIG